MIAPGHQRVDEIPLQVRRHNMGAGLFMIGSGILMILIMAVVL